MYFDSFTSSKRGSEVTGKHKIITKRPSGSNKISIKNSLINQTDRFTFQSSNQPNTKSFTQHHLLATKQFWIWRSATNYNYLTKIKLYYAVREY